MSPTELRKLLKVYFIMGSPNCLKKPTEVLMDAVEAGITLFQFREKGTGALTGQEKYQLAEELQFICKRSSIPFIVNDDMDLAIELNADGVHIGQDDELAEVVRERLGTDKILGVSVHNLTEARKANKAGADYFGVGPIFPTQTKNDANPVQGIKILKEFRSYGMTTPIVGIGGIHADNASSVIRAGADGVSVITAISHAEDTKKAVQTLREAVFTNR
jgi:thiamine-phosphate pyrophosphorylase